MFHLKNLKMTVEELIAQNKTLEAIKILEKYTADAYLLQARYNNNERAYLLGLIDIHEYSRQKTAINVEVLKKAKEYNI